MLFVKPKGNNAFVECVWQKEEHAIHTQVETFFIDSRYTQLC